jgi:uncharacterized protein with FMN-binding domain
MKKFILTFVMSGAFALYIVSQKINSNEAVVIPPQFINNSSQSASAGRTANNSPTASQSDPLTQNTNPSPSANQKTAPSTPASTGKYKDGAYTGNSVDAYYGLVQVKAIVSGGKITDVQFLNYPQDRGTSRQINSQAMPYLTQEAIVVQSAQVDIVSGATDTSQAFQQSLASALTQAM